VLLTSLDYRKLLLLNILIGDCYFLFCFPQMYLTFLFTWDETDETWEEISRKCNM